jgi:hypothetical protein
MKNNIIALISTLFTKKMVIIILSVILFMVFIYYLWLVGLTAHTRSMMYYELRPKPGLTLPTASDECKLALKATSLNPHGDVKHPEFKEYGNLWTLDWAKTRMYDSAILQNLACFNYLIAEMTAAQDRLILVVYDRKKDREVLIIRNYHKGYRYE